MRRLTAQHPGYVAFATMTVAVAVGVNLVVFCVVNALWLKPLPFPNADRLIIITNPPYVTLDTPTFESFEAVAGQVITSDRESGLRPQIVFDRVGREVETLGVTPDYFRLFGLAIRGHDFTPDHDRPGAEPVAIISDRLWSREFGRRLDVIGTVAAARPFPVRIIGVAPPDFVGARRGEKVDVWIPSKLVLRVASAGTSTSRDDNLMLMVFARLRPGQTPAEVKRRLVETADERGRGFLRHFAIVPLKDVFGTPESRTIVIREGGALGVVAGLAMLVLLGGCATLMALVLVHYERRRHALAVRIALGASQRRLTAELSRELGAIAVGGTIGAVVIAIWGLRAIPSLTLPGGVDLGRLDLSVDWRVLGVAVAATVLTLVAAAWLPINRFTRAGLAGELLAGPAATTSASSQRVRQTLLALHVCATIVVLVAAGLFVRAVIHGFGDASGFDADRTVFVTVQIKAPISRLEAVSFSAWREAIEVRTVRLREALRSLPGVDDVATGWPPIGPEPADTVLVPRPVETQRERRDLLLGTLSGSPELLATLGIPILAGRGLAAADATVKPSPAVITASLARVLWPAEDSIGQVLSLGAREGRVRIVGIARDFAFGSLARPAAGVVVTARSEGFGIEPRFAIRAAYPELLAEPIRKTVFGAEPDAKWVKAETGREIIARDLGRQRLGAWFFSGFGLAALILGLGGVFGLVAYLAESRQREFGVRLVLGATPRDLLLHGLAAALVPVSLGVATGLLLAAGVARVFASMLAGLSAVDPLTYVMVAVTMLGCASIAGVGAAWRLRHVAPGDALRTN